MTRFVAVVSVGLFVMSLSGCGEKGPRIAPVSGVVLYDGKPVEGATVEFVVPGAPFRSVGSTDDDGAFEITSLKPGDGATVGTNKVTVTKRTKSTAGTPAAEPVIVDLESISDPEERRMAASKNSVIQKTAAHESGAATQQRPRDLLPAKYAKVETSGLEFEVEAGQANEFQIVLSD